MKIGIAARWNPLDKRSWSGTTYYSYQQISRHFETEIFHFKWPWRVREWHTMQKSMNRRFFKKQTAVEFLRSYAKYYSKQLSLELEKRPVDLLFVSASSQMLAYINTPVPIVYMTDATFKQLQGYYPSFSNLPSYNIRQGIRLDKKAFLRADHCMLASEWNKRSAIQDYGIAPSKISVVPCGANLDIVPAASSIVFEQEQQCRLLFLGVEWERKGGDIVVDVCKILHEKGFTPRLHIIGCIPPVDLPSDLDITVIPFLDKNQTEDLHQLEQVFRQTDLLVLPTRAECAGVVFSECSSYGIPSVTTDTGGVSSYVKNGVNGFALPIDAGPADYAAKIMEILNDRQGLLQLRYSTRAWYDQQLSWETWGSKFKQLAENLVTSKNL